ncbi:metal-sensitive transcriptional regulator [Gulosibacter molinativorax]|uniref:Metal-sensitive transcriptional regulator n=1 Tax=Gulosibacter molinativorax TaxID=256821 RepID=A0ABT7C7J9_9MICO|nr:metal-sensitive transcriptional regulator [Gulosibacter molinativorax]MDJ1370754.1 metal-sensitive transcriptional regulator [Gulosibacter molinativorax]QUY63219.1 Copper-sensing transcriptional repressor csoR [Gulosibacter molinativorax]
MNDADPTVESVESAEPVESVEPVETPEPAGPTTHTHTHGYRHDVQPLKNRLKRVEGQVRGVERMIDDDAYCIDVITQISAIKAALDRVSTILLEDHIDHCMAEAAESGDPEITKIKVAEVRDAVARLLK